MFLTRLCALAAAVATSACIASTTTITVKPDGSGTIDQTTTMRPEVASQFAQMAAMSGDKQQATVDVFSEDGARKALEHMGEGVRLVKTEPIHSADATGLHAVYAFDDVRKLRMTQQPAGPMGGSMGAQPAPQTSNDVSFDFTRAAAAGPSVLTIHFPQPATPAGDATPTPQPPAQPDPQALAMARQFMKGMRIEMALVADGRIVRTNSPYVEGSKVTLLLMDFDRVLQDEAQLAKLQSMPRDITQAQALLKDIPGFKVPVEREIQVEFTGR
jgi:hypothetical protein